ncbi:DNA polymerase III subunit alpha [Pseudomonas sp. JL972]|uniref:error-prone DNA polymerase n=1 Tax=Stutzerimonas degradans TaxID=2968968 RepID=UPI0012D8ACA3|nr:error-prone DNA polymerase [Stutzerimonas degradans]MTZ15385.1 DNA polymerase III subunit alpha [Stutzerimonas degradans]
MSDYAELHCLSNFSFQRGASSARELFERAARLGYRALAITDECTLAGIVRAWQAAKDNGLPLIVGSELRIENGPRLILLVENLTGYQALCRLITLARRRCEKGRYRLLLDDFAESPDGLLAIWLPDDDDRHLPWLRRLFPQRLWLAVELHRGADDAAQLQHLLERATSCGLPPVACGDVHMHARGRRALQDCMTAIRHHLPVAEAGAHLFPNGERHLRRHEELAELYPPALLAETLRIAARCTFDLGQLRYHYPRELVPHGHDATSWLRELVERGARWRWPDGVPEQARGLLEHELKLIAELAYESYFLTVHDIVNWARERQILCQGRGSAANSTVCFALGITELDPTLPGRRLLFERFLSRERKEPPDIDVDFEHERREEVIQYVFSRYGRHRAALTAVVSTYHSAGALRDVAKALGLPADQVNALADCCGRWSDRVPSAERLAEAGFDANNPLLRRVLALTGELIGFPRHLSQHPGGFVISEHPLQTLVPVENASMAERTVIQWDKDDLDLVGLLKVDVLALGMLSALRRCFALIERYRGTRWTLATLPQEDPATYAMISRADTIGVFQIESRAQMAMLPRLRPRKFYDLVIQVAIVRPGPIQGDMVHPYLRRRNGEEPVLYPSDELMPVFERTLGVPLFQEQVMELAIIAADYSPGEADELRRSMAAWKRHGGLEHHRERLTARMLDKQYEPEFITRIFEQIKGFGSYGFPESHAASFALLTYASSWLKCHEPAAFACALINSWPMGFYSPDQVLQDARRHGIEVRPVDVCHSDWDCSLEPGAEAQPSIRLGLRMIRGLREADARRIESARRTQAFSDVDDLSRRAGLDARARERLADAGALHGLAGHRHHARWAVAGVEPQLPLFAELAATTEAPVNLPLPTTGEDLLTDYATLGTTLGPHPLTLLRDQLRARRCRSSRELADAEPGRPVSVAGLVIGRQRPQTASGVVFVTLEDEFGLINVVVWQHLAERQHPVLLQSQLLQVDGHLESAHGVRHVIAGRLRDLSALLSGLDVRSRDFQ